MSTNPKIRLDPPTLRWVADWHREWERDARTAKCIEAANEHGRRAATWERIAKECEADPTLLSDPVSV